VTCSKCGRKWVLCGGTCSSFTQWISSSVGALRSRRPVRGTDVMVTTPGRWDGRQGYGPASWIALGGVLAGLATVGALLQAAWGAL
jgi:hypothetical protein